MKKKRERLEVIHDILELIRDNGNSIRPTRLLRQSNLSSQRFNEYITELISKNLIREALDKKSKRHFTLTDDGFEYLRKYQLIRGFIDEFNL